VLRVLILDEHPGSRRMLRFVLGSSGHQVAAVGSVDEAMECLRGFGPDAIVYDWNTRCGPLLGFGREVRSRISSVRAVIVMSSRDEPMDFCTSEAVDAYFTKPCAMADVARQLEVFVRTMPTPH
jgi:DNA-binding response OmpR family regulator